MFIDKYSHLSSTDIDGERRKKMMTPYYVVYVLRDTRNTVTSSILQNIK